MQVSFPILTFKNINNMDANKVTFNKINYLNTSVAIFTNITNVIFRSLVLTNNVAECLSSISC